MPHRFIRLLPALKRSNPLLTALILVAAAAAWFGHTPGKNPASASEGLTCKVAHVHDGDTLRADCPGEKKATRIRIRQIDAPEIDQKYGVASRNYLRELCSKGTAVQIWVHSTDKYDRTLADIACNGDDVGMAMVSAGAAWVYEQYAEDKRLVTAQRQAREARRGLWQDQNPVAPWKFRQTQRQ